MGIIILNAISPCFLAGLLSSLMGAAGACFFPNVPLDDAA